jgi:hypothetical protein
MFTYKKRNNALTKRDLRGKVFTPNVEICFLQGIYNCQPRMEPFHALFEYLIIRPKEFIRSCRLELYLKLFPSITIE